ncbi:hypothetical protein SAMN05216215_102026 [Saccharopolyspora shandongensis]|uniref:Uncharacterized protein n=1 Tax=Saccharopolyspora shandongensis TaxID=418495 RepID=A0A1H3H6N1_9PSEU|nr:hypothetical protein SAMN05216215_102026 [Saccharopolyspora shandongensis]
MVVRIRFRGKRYPGAECPPKNPEHKLPEEDTRVPDDTANAWRSFFGR